MDRKCWFRKLQVVLACLLLSNHFTFAAVGGTAQMAAEAEPASVAMYWIVIFMLALLPIGLFFFSAKQKKQLANRCQELAKEKEELARQKAEAEKEKEEGAAKLAEQARTLSTLAGSKKELEQFLVAKIKENDQIQREAAEQQQQALQKIKDAENIHDTFFIQTIHEMRTPLSLVLGSLSLIMQNKDRENDLSTALLSAYRNTLAMQDLADQLIGTRRTNDVASYLRIARYDMVEITRQICDLFVDWVAMNNVDFRIHTQTEKLWVWLDRRKMEFALRMLLSNAFKNTFAYGKVVVNLSVVREEGKAYSSITVNDEGLDEEESARRGLKQIIDMVGDIGGIYHADADKNGTSYSLLIPLGKQHLLDRRVEFVEPEADLVKLNDRQKEEIAELIQVIPQKKDTGKKLLVIDDSDQIRWFLKHVFNKEYQILEARNGEEGIQVAFKEEPDLVLCDVMMPVKDGFETCKAIKNNSQTAQIPVVMLTAKVESEDVITGIEAGADDYITKPFDVEILRTKINSLMKKREEMKRYFIKVEPTEAPDKEEAPVNPFMDAVIKNIEKHLDDSTFEAKVLADSLNMSLPTLYRKIKQYSDCSILELTRNIRLKKAAQLIMTQQYSIQEVSEMVGFNDTATFRKRFTEQYGVTPSQYGQPHA